MNTNTNSNRQLATYLPFYTVRLGMYCIVLMGSQAQLFFFFSMLAWEENEAIQGNLDLLSDDDPGPCIGNTSQNLEGRTPSAVQVSIHSWHW